MNFTKYEKYKDSGLEWLGEIPENWEIVGFKKYIEPIIDYRGKTPEKVDEGVFLITARNVKNGRIDYQISQEFVKESEYDLIMSRGKPRIGDLLFTMEAPLGEVATIDRIDIALAQRIIKICGIKKHLDNRFLKYWIMSSLFQQDLYRFATGSTAVGIKSSKLSQLRLVFPPFQIQNAIVEYLNEKTAQVDKKIELLQAKKEKYRELRKTIINEAVTKGINKNIELKDSGVSWIGEIPTHWSFERFGDKFRHNKRKNSNLENDNLLSLSYGKIKRKDINSSFGLLPESFETYQIVEEGDIILRLTDLQNDWNSLRVGLVKEKGIITSAYVGLKLSKTLYPTFIYYLLHNYDIKKVFYSQGGSIRQSMKFADIKSMPLLHPDFNTQVEIAKYLDEKTSKIDEIVLTIDKNIEAFKEFRKTLINDAVTGKIKIVPDEKSAV